MPLTNLLIQKAKPKDKAWKLFDGRGLFLLVSANDGPPGSQLFLIEVYDVHVLSSHELKRPNEPFVSGRSQLVQTCADRLGPWIEY